MESVTAQTWADLATTRDGNKPVKQNEPQFISKESEPGGDQFLADDARPPLSTRLVKPVWFNHKLCNLWFDNGNGRR